MLIDATNSLQELENKKILIEKCHFIIEVRFNLISYGKSSRYIFVCVGFTCTETGFCLGHLDVIGEVVKHG